MTKITDGSEGTQGWRKTEAACGGTLLLAGVGVITWVVIAILKHPGMITNNAVRGSLGALGVAQLLMIGAPWLAEGLGYTWLARKRRQTIAKVTGQSDRIGGAQL